METVEPVFGQIKQRRGFRQFLLRGLTKVNREWLLICVGHNLLKLFRFGAGQPRRMRADAAAGAVKQPGLAEIIRIIASLAGRINSAAARTAAAA